MLVVVPRERPGKEETARRLELGQTVDAGADRSDPGLGILRARASRGGQDRVNSGDAVRCGETALAELGDRRAIACDLELADADSLDPGSSIRSEILREARGKRRQLGDRDSLAAIHARKISHGTGTRGDAGEKPALREGILPMTRRSSTGHSPRAEQTGRDGCRMPEPARGSAMAYTAPYEATSKLELPVA